MYDQELRMVFGATTYRAHAQMLAAGEEIEALDPWVTRMRDLPAVVVSNTLEEPLDWPDATVMRGDPVHNVARLKKGSAVPPRSHGSLSLNRVLMAAGLVDLVHVTFFPVITGQSGVHPIFAGGADFDLELIEQRTLDGHTAELVTDPPSTDHARDAPNARSGQGDPSDEPGPPAVPTQVQAPERGSLQRGPRLAGGVACAPLPDGSVDAVLSTIVLCSVRDQGQALAEVLRVLRPVRPPISCCLSASYAAMSCTTRSGLGPPPIAGASLAFLGPGQRTGAQRTGGSRETCR